MDNANQGVSPAAISQAGAFASNFKHYPSVKAKLILIRPFGRNKVEDYSTHGVKTETISLDVSVVLQRRLLLAGLEGKTVGYFFLNWNKHP